MYKNGMKADEDILDMMLKDAVFVKDNSSRTDKETIRKLIEGKENEFLQGTAVGSVLQEEQLKGKENQLYKGSIEIKVSSDKLVARVCLYPDGELEHITEKDINDALKEFHIVKGIQSTQIRRLVKMPIYRKSFVAAKGVKPIKGKPGHIKYYFDTDKTPKFQESDRGKIDYKEIGTVKCVKKGDLLCELISGCEGSDGIDVYGEKIPAEQVKLNMVRAGKNVKASENGSQLFADSDGEVSCVNGTVTVDRVLRVKNVDASTGNIRFIGSVHVEGKVCEGYIVKATRDIVVKEIVENAKLSAGNDITITGGIIGGKSGEIAAEGSLTTGFIENANLQIKKDIEADVILNSQIVCEGRVKLKGKKGNLIGGTCIARDIEADKIGNDAHARTDIEILSINQIVADLEFEKTKLTEINEENAKKQELLNLYKRSNEDPQKCVELQTAILQMVYKKNACKAKVEELSSKIESIRGEYAGQIKVKDRLFPNIRIKIEGEQFINQDMQRGCTLYYDGDQIVIGSMSV